MEYRYDIVLDGYMGERYGTLAWSETDGTISGKFSLFDFDNPINGRRDGHCLELRHILRTAVSTLDCTTILKLNHKELSGTVTSQFGQIRLRGKRAEERLTIKSQAEMSVKE